MKLKTIELAGKEPIWREILARARPGEVLLLRDNILIKQQLPLYARVYQVLSLDAFQTSEAYFLKKWRNRTIEVALERENLTYMPTRIDRGPEAERLLALIKELYIN